jgi:hypothetical protein
VEASVAALVEHLLIPGRRSRQNRSSAGLGEMMTALTWDKKARSRVLDERLQASTIQAWPGILKSWTY